MYAISNIPTPNSIIREVNSIMYKFLWNGNDKVRRVVLSAEYDKGGLKMINLEAKLKTQAIIWIKRLVFGDFHQWKIIPLKYFSQFGGPELFFSCNFSSKYIPKESMTLFYLNLCRYWEEVSCRNPCQIQNEIIWNNKHILSNKQMIFHKTFFLKGLIFVKQLFNDKGSVLSWEEVKSRF